jgi:FMN-dependent NADH-azoreductase
MTVLRIDASIQGPRSASSELADVVSAELVAGRPDEAVVTRHLGADPLPATAWADAVAAGFVPADDRTPAQREAVALASTLLGELTAADGVVLAFPLYNWGVSQHVKAWIDLVIAASGPGVAVLDGVPTVLIVTRGGGYGPGAPKAEWEHSIAYLRRILVDVWGADLTVVERDLTLVGVNPAMDGLTEEAGMAHKQAQEAAVAAGRVLATR